MPFQTEYAALGDPPPRSATRAVGRFYLGQSYAASIGITPRLDAQVVFAVGLGYATNVFPEGFALVSPATYVQQEVTAPYGPLGQPISPDTGTG